MALVCECWVARALFFRAFQPFRVLSRLQFRCRITQTTHRAASTTALMHGSQGLRAPRLPPRVLDGLSPGAPRDRRSNRQRQPRHLGGHVVSPAACNQADTQRVAAAMQRPPWHNSQQQPLAFERLGTKRSRLRSNALEPRKTTTMTSRKRWVIWLRLACWPREG